MTTLDGYFAHEFYLARAADLQQAVRRVRLPRRAAYRCEEAFGGARGPRHRRRALAFGVLMGLGASFLLPPTHEAAAVGERFEVSFSYHSRVSSSLDDCQDGVNCVFESSATGTFTGIAFEWDGQQWQQLGGGLWSGQFVVSGSYTVAVHPGDPGCRANVSVESTTDRAAIDFGYVVGHPGDPVIYFHPGEATDYILSNINVTGCESEERHEVAPWSFLSVAACPSIEQPGTVRAVPVSDGAGGTRLDLNCSAVYTYSRSPGVIHTVESTITGFAGCTPSQTLQAAVSPTVAQTQTPQAPVCAPLAVNITAATRDAVKGWTTKSGRPIDAPYYSVPRQGETNHFQRTVTLDYTITRDTTDLTNDIDISNVKVELIAGGEQQIIVDRPPDGSITVLAPGRIEIPVTFDGQNTPASGIDTSPPPTHRIEYRITLTVEDPERDNEPTAGVHTIDGFGLWRIPDGIARFGPCAGPRDLGGDDWASQSTYEWLTRNGSRVPAINDISGEHGRDIGHTEHRIGTDLDVFHFHRAPALSNCSGGVEYQRLAGIAAEVASTNVLSADNRAELTTWVRATRLAVDDLLALRGVDLVRQLFYAEGCSVWDTNGLGVAGGVLTPVRVVNNRAAHTRDVQHCLAWQGRNRLNPVPIEVLSNGWAEDLMLTSVLTDANGTTWDLGLGAWNPPRRMVFNQVHNDHAHISLPH